MLSPEKFGVTKNPIIETPFIQNFESGGNYPPPGTNFMETENGLLMQAENGQNMITE